MLDILTSWSIYSMTFVARHNFFALELQCLFIVIRKAHIDKLSRIVDIERSTWTTLRSNLFSSATHCEHISYFFAEICSIYFVELFVIHWQYDFSFSIATKSLEHTSRTTKKESLRIKQFAWLSRDCFAWWRWRLKDFDNLDVSRKKQRNFSKCEYVKVLSNFENCVIIDLWFLDIDDCDHICNKKNRRTFSWLDFNFNIWRKTCLHQLLTSMYTWSRAQTVISKSWQLSKRTIYWYSETIR